MAGIKHTEPLRDRNQFGEGMHLHLLHHLVAMCFHGALGRSQLMGDLLVDLAADDQIENLPLSRRQGRYEPAKGIELVPLMRATRSAPWRARSRRSVVRRCRLGQEILGAGLDGPHRRRRVGIPGNEHDRQDRTSLDEAALQFKAAQARICTSSRMHPGLSTPGT